MDCVFMQCLQRAYCDLRKYGMPKRKTNDDNTINSHNDYKLQNLLIVYVNEHKEVVKRLGFQ